MPYTKTLDPAGGLPPLPENWAGDHFLLGRIHGRVELFGLLWMLYVAMSLLGRIVLSGASLRAGLVAWNMLPRSFAMGMLLDAVTGLYMCTPFAVYLWLAPKRLFDSRFGRGLVHVGFALAIAGFAYLVAAEYFFFDEFNARFNHIAVEHLIQPAEVFTNIRDAYPVGRASLTAAWTGVVTTYFLRKRIAGAFGDTSAIAHRTLGILALVALIALSLPSINLEIAQGANTNRISGELAKNGVYSFFGALRNALDLSSASRHTPLSFLQGVPGVRNYGGGRYVDTSHAGYAIVSVFDNPGTRLQCKDTMLVITDDQGAPSPSPLSPGLFNSGKHRKQV